MLASFFRLSHVCLSIQLVSWSTSMWTSELQQAHVYQCLELLISLSSTAICNPLPYGSLLIFCAHFHTYKHIWYSVYLKYTPTFLWMLLWMGSNHLCCFLSSILMGKSQNSLKSNTPSLTWLLKSFSESGLCAVITGTLTHATAEGTKVSSVKIEKEERAGPERTWKQRSLAVVQKHMLSPRSP